MTVAIVIVSRRPPSSGDEKAKAELRFLQVENVAIPPFDESGIFLSKEFVPPLDGGVAIREALQKGEALGIKVVQKPGEV